MIKELANKNLIKLEDLEIEDILKFGDEAFLNPSLCNNFNLSLKEVKKIRKQKKLENAYLEDFVRDMIVMANYFVSKDKNYSKDDINSLILFLVSNSIRFKGKEEFYLEKIKEFDFINMDYALEIEKRKIDVSWRNERFLNQIYPIIDRFFIEKNDNVQDLIFEEEKKVKPAKEKISTITYTYPRNRKLAESVLENSNYLCSLNHNHKSFINKITNKPYMQAHHIIPLNYQFMFENSLDIKDNIVCLCSMCHDEIHHGINQKELIEKLYNLNHYKLKENGLDITLEELFELYM